MRLRHIVIMILRLYSPGWKRCGAGRQVETAASTTRRLSVTVLLDTTKLQLGLRHPWEELRDIHAALWLTGTTDADLFTAKTRKRDSLSTELQPVVAIAKMLRQKPATLLELGERGSVCLKAFSR